MAADKTPSGYDYHRKWFDFAFENPGVVTGNHGCMYIWFVELNNRLGWVKTFGAPRDHTMAAVGISSYNTYKKCFNDLVEWGFIKVISQSKNQYMANIIALSNFDKPLDKALDKALIGHLTKQSTGTVAIIKQVNKETSKQVNIYSDFIFFNDDFKLVWEAYLDMRKKIKKPASKHGEILVLKKLTELSKNDVAAAIKIIEQSILNSWQGVFELKMDFQKNNNQNGAKNRSGISAVDQATIDYFTEKYGSIDIGDNE